jgi:hypothetical protein
MMQIRGMEVTTEEVCEALTRHLEESGEELFEKNFIKNGEILVSIFAIIGPNAPEMTALFREWAMGSGFKRHS